jgi:hypothetical protein
MDRDKWETFAAENNLPIEAHKEFVIRRSADFTYKPKEPRLKQDEGKFIH